MIKYDYEVAMNRLTISIPEQMSTYVETQISSGRYGNVSEYFRDLVRRDQDRADADAQLRTLIQEGIDSGLSERTVPEIMARVEERLRRNGQIPTNT